MANTTVRLNIRCAAGYSIPPKKLIDLPPGQTYYLVWFEGARKCVRSVGHFSDAAQVALINKQSELRKAAINPQTQGQRNTQQSDVTEKPLLADAATEYLNRVKKSKKHKTFLAYNRAVMDFLAVVGDKPSDDLTRKDSPDQWASNVSTKGNAERVEFAVKLPGQGADKSEVVWLPIDAKFPVEDYQRLIEAQERADIEGIEAAGKELENRVRGCARDICDKYLSPPNTTDFGILYLPIEGLFAETIRRTGLIEGIQRNYRVIVAGPTTLWSILNSLQMGFRTLAIEKRTSEVWNLLSGVKSEWLLYGNVLNAVQKKLQQASNKIEEVQVRSRAIGRKLKDVQELPALEATALLSPTLLAEVVESNEEEDLEVEETGE